MRKHISLTSLIALLMILFTSCLKDDPITDYTNIQPVVIIPNANWPKNTATAATAVPFASSSAYVVTLYARVSWEKSLGTALNVTFVKDEAAITAYNLKFNTSYLPVPDAAITAANLKAVIAAGSNDASVPVTLNLSLLDPTKTYILPYSIADAEGQTIAANYKSYLLPLKNK